MSDEMVPRWLSWQPSAVLLDLDDVLLDTTTCREATWRWWAKRVGVDPDLLAEAAWGRPTAEVVREFAPTCDPDAEFAAICDRERILLRTVQPARGAWSFMRTLPPGRWGIISHGTQAQTQARWRRARFPDPPLLLTADEIPIGRPDPAGHLAAAETLGMAPETCLAIEGSPAGAAAAAAAGMIALLVMPGIERVKPPAATAVIHRLSALRVELIQDGIELTMRSESERGW